MRRRTRGVELFGAAQIGHVLHKTAQVTITAAQLKALNATPQTLVAAPGAGFYAIFDGATIELDYGTAAYAGIAAGEDLAIRYTNGSGAIVGQCEATGFLDATADAVRRVMPFCGGGTPASPAASDITPVANAALVLHMTSGEITTGDSPLYITIAYRILKSKL